MNDAKKWEQIKSGNKEVFTEIYQQNINSLYNYGLKINTNRVIIEDCIQELFIEIWTKRDKLADNLYSIKFYLMKSLRRRILRMLSKSNPSISPEDSKDSLIEFSCEFEIIEKQTNQEKVTFLKESFKNLSQREKEAIYLKYYDDLSYKEIAAIMQITPKTAYNLVYKGIAKLKKHNPSSINQ